MGWKIVGISILAGLIVAGGLYFLAAKGVEAEMESRGHFDQTISLEPGMSQDYVLASLISGMYDFDVSAHDGAVLMAWGLVEDERSPEVSPEQRVAIARTGVRVEAGKRHRMTGKFNRGRYFWTVINLSMDKPVEVTIRFHS